MVRTGGSASAGFNWQFAGRLAVAEARKALDDLAAFAVSHPNNYDGLQAYGSVTRLRKGHHPAQERQQHSCTLSMSSTAAL